MHRNWEWEDIGKDECLAQSYTSSELSMFQVRKCAITAGQGKQKPLKIVERLGICLLACFLWPTYLLKAIEKQAFFA